MNIMNDYMEYVHLGKTKFDKEEFFSIRNSDFGTKPRGGYWASPTDSNKTYEDDILGLYYLRIS